MRINIKEITGDFAENKDVAAKLREDNVREFVNKKKVIELNFEGVTLTTQSFIHALISDVLRKNGEITGLFTLTKQIHDGTNGYSFKRSAAVRRW